MSEYRDASARQVERLVVRYSPFERTAILWVLPWVVGIGWAVSRKTGLPALEHAAIGLVFIGILCFAMFPIVSIHASFEGGEVVVRGSRWPFAVQMWTMSPHEAETFQIARSTEKGRPYWHVGLRVSDGRQLPVTHLFTGRPDKHAAAVVRLNAWLEQLH